MRVAMAVDLQDLPLVALALVVGDPAWVRTDPWGLQVPLALDHAVASFLAPCSEGQEACLDPCLKRALAVPDAVMCKCISI